jgi:hypothetical protein
MSTKTLRKRIALVAVAALGFGLVSGTPTNAAPVVGPLNYTSSLTQSWTALTVVGAATTSVNGFFYVDTTNLQTPAVVATTDTNALPLQTGETIQVSVSAAPTGRAVTDLNINSVTNTGALPATAFINGVLAGGMGDEDILVADTDAVNSPNSSFSATLALNNESNRYWFAVNTDTAAALGAGKYTIRVRLTNVNSQVIDYTMTVKFVASIADAGAVLTLAKTGSITNGAPFVTTANTSVTATLRDADGGRIHVGQATTGQRVLWDPALNANMMEAAVVGADTLTATDNGVAGADFVACATSGAAACGVTPASPGITQLVSQASLATGDGVYSVNAAGNIAAVASSTSTVRVRVDGTSVSASIAVPVITATTTAVAGALVLLTATGTSLANQEYLAPTITTVASVNSSALAYSLPVSATTAKLTVDTTSTTAGQALTATTTWSGNYATANVTPASANVQTVYTDASGKVVINLTNSSPVAGGVATVKITGFALVADSLTITSTWAAATMDTLTVVDPVSGIYAALKATTVVTLIAKDQFGNALAGEQITPSLGADSANYSATTKYPVITTGTNGTATFTWTDALAVADDEDNLTFTSVTGAKTATFDLTYKTTVPAATTLTGFQSSTQAAAADVASRGVSISSSAGLTGTLMIARNLSKTLAALATGETTTDDMYAVRIRAVTSTGAAATGAAVTLTASAGGHVQDVTGLPASSRTVAVDANGDAYFRILATATGKITFTATSGTASFAFPVTIADQTYTAARFVTVTGATTGTANGSGVPVSAVVTDRYGNGVANVTLVVTASGVGAFMGGQTSQSFTTDATGKYTFLATSYTAAGGAATYSVNASNAGDATSVAGYQAAVVIDPTVKAGNQAASVTVTFAEGTNAAEANAQAATDAAAEATDAANAATDAANAAAEAADAATAAAQDAADAVAALSVQVSEMVNALKKQITALTNLVIKIQKKVKA